MTFRPIGWRLGHIKRCSTRMPLEAWKNIRSDAVGYPGRRFLDRIPRKMGVARRSLRLSVPEQLPDHGQALAER